VRPRPLPGPRGGHPRGLDPHPPSRQRGGELVALQRLIITFKPEELVVHALYRTQDGPGPSVESEATL
jgi:hypothetical protein